MFDSNAKISPAILINFATVTTLMIIQYLSYFCPSVKKLNITGISSIGKHTLIKMPKKVRYTLQKNVFHLKLLALIPSMLSG